MSVEAQWAQFFAESLDTARIIHEREVLPARRKGVIVDEVEAPDSRGDDRDDRGGDSIRSLGRRRQLDLTVDDPEGGTTEL